MGVIEFHLFFMETRPFNAIFADNVYITKVFVSETETEETETETETGRQGELREQNLFCPQRKGSVGSKSLQHIWVTNRI